MSVDRKTQLDRELKRITETMVRDYHPQRIILFGSLATGRVHEMRMHRDYAASNHGVQRPRRSP